MSSISIRKMSGLILGIGLLLHVFIGKVAADDCTCDDCENLYSRIVEVQAVMQEICTEATNHPTFYYKDYSAFWYHVLYMGRWQEAMNAACRNNPVFTPSPTGQTDPFCNTKINHPERNACVAKAVQIHEDVHAATCRDIMKTSSSCHDSSDGYLGCVTMGEYYKDDYNAYSTELQFEINQFQNLKGSKRCCTTLNINTTIPPCDPPAFHSMLIRKLIRYLVG